MPNRDLMAGLGRERFQEIEANGSKFPQWQNFQNIKRLGSVSFDGRKRAAKRLDIEAAGEGWVKSLQVPNRDRRG
jgi:hypothetical protein